MPIKVRQILDMNAFDDSGDPGSGSELLRLRRRNAGAASVLFYREPIEMIRAAGCWMEAADGTKYLDFYNNVPSVGHSHPRVADAVARQVATLNVNSRYLNALTEEYIDRLKATFPSHLENVVLTCSGSEANDLAMRIAMKGSGGTGFIVTETAYHGNTRTVTEISPSALKNGTPPDYVCLVPAPGSAAFGNDIAGGFTKAIDEAIVTLTARGYPLAALICDSIFSSDGVFADPAGFLNGAVDAVHKAGGIYIADEVQPGFARTGEAFWGFARHGVAPDLVTMGKPMGNGYPVAGVAARPDLLAAFCEDVGYFNTFGGTPAAAAAGLSVLDVIEEEGLQENARSIGAYLKTRLMELSNSERRLTAVRGAGLFIGVDLCAEGDPERPDPDLASGAINALRERRVLIGAAGRYGHTLKIRPPLCLSRDEADFFVDALANALAAIPS